MKQVCSVEGCEKSARARGLCKNHYGRLHTHGDPLGGRVTFGEPLAWIEAHVDHQGDACLTWPFGHDGRGYGGIVVNGQKTGAHRYMCGRVHGPAPTSKHQSAHNCGRGHLGCVNPRHLSWKTPKENEADKIFHGTLQQGELIHHAKLTTAEVHAIKMFGEWGFHGWEIVALARVYGVHRKTIGQIFSGKNWKHVQTQVDSVHPTGGRRKLVEDRGLTADDIWDGGYTGEQPL